MGKGTVNNSDIEVLEQELSEASGKEKIIILNKLSELFHLSNPVKSAEYCKECLDLLEDYPDKILESKLLGDICWSYQNSGKYREAMEYGFKRLNLAVELKNRKEEASSYSRIGIVYWRLACYEDALNYHLKALSLFEDLDDRNGLAGTYTNIGILYFDMENYDRAIEYCNKVFEVLGDVHDDKSILHISNALNNIGAIHEVLGNFKEALKCHRESLRIREEQNDRKGISQSIINIGISLEGLGKHQKALDNFFRSLEITREIENQKTEAEALQNIGISCASLNNLEEALSYFKQCLDIAEKIDAKCLLCDSLSYISSTYEKISEPGKALDYFKRCRSLEKEIFSEDSKKKMLELEIRHNVKSKINEAEITRQKNKELAEANKELRNALDKVKTLSGLLPICANCKKIREDDGYWRQLESYFIKHSEIHFSHGLCPECLKKLYPELND
ncbi:MAG: tetratricopeptide repeat protein [Candidatus Aegiribacteria sp.]|nr:tetratricopeptide repeat protein [Candidatus Aegiribacteria sp.]